MKQIFIAAALVFSMNSHAATQDLDQLLSKIEADIKAQRLAKPAGNNALEGIDAFRAQAPFDFRITPLIYKFGESYVALANKAMAKKNYDQAQGYLDTAWQVAALTPGLEEAQAKNDKLSSGKAKSKPKATKKGPSAAEIKKQKAIAAAAAAEKKRLDKERKKKAQAEKNAKAAATKKAAAAKKAKQEAERKKRLAAEKALAKKNQAAKESAQKKKLNAQLAAAEAEKARLEALAQKAKAKPVVKKAPAPKPAVVASTSTLVVKAIETSSPIASYPLAQDKITNRDRKISEDLQPICKAIIDNDASIVLHTSTKADYRWLTVRLTLCARRLDPGFRLRHSFQAESNEGPFMTLHPARDTALIGKRI